MIVWIDSSSCVLYLYLIFSFWLYLDKIQKICIWIMPDECNSMSTINIASFHATLISITYIYTYIYIYCIYIIYIYIYILYRESKRVKNMSFAMQHIHNPYLFTYIRFYYFFVVLSILVLLQFLGSVCKSRL